MHRRPLAPTRVASAVWARRLAIGAALAAGVAVIVAHRSGTPPMAAVFGLVVALASACVAILCGLKALGTIWRSGRPGLSRALFGIVLAGSTLAYPAYVVASVLQGPIVVGATTDPAAAPRLSRSARAVTVRGSETEAPTGSLATVAPITVDATPADAFDAVKQAVADLRWRVVEAMPPGGRLGLGHVDAVAFSPVLHLPQDIAIVLTPIAGQTRIDVLSVARLGLCDFGLGAKSIRQLDEAIEAQADD